MVFWIDYDILKDQLNTNNFKKFISYDRIIWLKKGWMVKKKYMYSRKRAKV